MPKLALFLICLPVVAAHAQGHLPWGYAVSPPVLATLPGNALFYVASYTRVGTHTDYDMARQAADAYLVAHPQTQTYLVLSPVATLTCDAVPLPTISIGAGVASSVSIIGYGSNSSSLAKTVGCTPSAATLAHHVSPSGTVTNALYQGFTINANHIDRAACEFDGMTNSIFLDLACNNATPGGDHEVEFGTTISHTEGMDSNIAIYNLKAGDNVGSGKGAILTPKWVNGSLDSVTLASGGSKEYTQQYTRAQVVGPDRSSCSVLPTVGIAVSHLLSVDYVTLPIVNYGWVTGATVTNRGHCARTEHLYLLIQDGVPETYGMKFSYTVKSHIWNLENTTSATYGEAWLPKSGNNQIIGEHGYTNQTIQITEYAVANKHVNAFFDSPGLYGAAIYGATGEFANSIFSWDGTGYLASSGYYLGSFGYVHYAIENSQCTNSSAHFFAFTNAEGPLTAGGPMPAGFAAHDIERCDGSKTIDWSTEVRSQ